MPNTTETRNFADEMSQYWIDSLIPPQYNQDLPHLLDFVFLDNETQLEAIYVMEGLEKPVQLAVVFDDDPFVNLSEIYHLI